MNYTITSPSAINPFRDCILGMGVTEKAAWEDAFGPKPWTPSQKRAASKATCRKARPEDEGCFYDEDYPNP